MKYVAVFDETALRSLLAVRGSRRREKVLDVITALAKNPFLEGNFSAMDHTGRPVQLRVVGRFVLSYWPDHGAKELRIIDIQPVE
jgi:hypothetical protein